jgi:hypothetical protein
MGGYNPLTGKGWSYKFTKEEQILFTLNTKEFMAATISQCLALDEDDSPNPCHLNIGDSAVSESWLYKSNFTPDENPVHNELQEPWGKISSNVESAIIHNIWQEKKTSSRIRSPETHTFHRNNTSLALLTSAAPHYSLKIS